MWGPKRKEEPKLLYFLNLNGFLRFLGKGSLHVYPDYFYFYIKSFTYLYMVSFVNIETPLVLIGHPETSCRITYTYCVSLTCFHVCYRPETFFIAHIIIIMQHKISGLYVYVFFF